MGAYLHLSTLTSSTSVSYRSSLRKRSASLITLCLLSPLKPTSGFNGGPENNERIEAVYLCCTFPEVAFGGRYPLSLPCEARTFLTHSLSACARGCPACSVCYHTSKSAKCQTNYQPMWSSSGKSMPEISHSPFSFTISTSTSPVIFPLL